jgi:hypothetical protein
MTEKPTSQDQEIFARARARLSFRNGSVAPVYLLPESFRALSLDALFLNEQGTNAAGDFKPEYIDKNADQDFPFDLSALIRDFDLIVDGALPLECLHIPVVTLRSEKYVEYIGTNPIYVDDVGGDLLALLIAACHEISEFPLVKGTIVEGTIKSEGLYIGLLYIYLVLQMASQSEDGQVLAASLYSHDQTLLDTIVEYGRGLVRHAETSRSVQIIRQRKEDWILNHERAHLILDKSPYIRISRWQNIQDSLKEMQGLPSPLHDAICQFSKIYPFLRELSPNSITAEEIACDYIMWQAYARSQVHFDDSASNMMNTIVAAQSFINSLVRLAEMQHLVAPFVLTGVPPSTDTIARFELENLSRRWICFETLSNITLQHYHAKTSSGFSSEANAEAVAKFIVSSEWPSEIRTKLVPHLNSRHQIWTSTLKFFNPFALRQIAVTAPAEITPEDLQFRFGAFVDRWQALCIDIWKDWNLVQSQSKPAT